MDNLDQFLNDYSEHIAGLAQHLRRFIQQTTPDAQEVLQRGWKSISYRHRRAFCSIVPHSTWVNLQFQSGSQLPDPVQRLQGTGKSMRHVRITQAKDLDSSLRDLVRHASESAR